MLELIDGLTFDSPPIAYADVGCSNGYITCRIMERLPAAEAAGFDYSKDLLAEARRNHPAIRFYRIDLNKTVEWPRRYDFVSCLETLEHVGDLERAVRNLAAALAPGGTLLISVPIEIGAWGTLKFLAKRSLGYGLDELPGPPSSLQYLRKLLVGRPISVLRDARKGWSTHFGFDYRDVEAKLEECGLGIARAETRAGNRIIVAGRREDGSRADDDARTVRRDGAVQRTGAEP